MRTGNRLLSPAIRIVLFYSFLAGVSCSTVFFDHPQPIDTRNMSNVPTTLQGTWKNIQKDYEEILTIDKNSYHKVALEGFHIPKSVLDVSKKYRLEDGKIYLTDEDINTGYTYESINDTISFRVRKEEEIVISDSALLRSAKNCYVLNLKRKNWWEIVFIQKMGNGEILISYPVSSDLIMKKSEYNIEVLDSTRKDSTYFHADFKSRTIDKVIPEDRSGVLYILKPDSTFETPAN